MSLNASGFLSNSVGPPLITEDGLKKELMDYFRWHVDQNPGLFLPYPVNPDLKDKYRVHHGDPQRESKRKIHFDNWEGAWKRKSYEEALEHVAKLKDLGTGGNFEEDVNRLTGITLRSQHRSDAAVVQLLLAEAINEYRWGGYNPQSSMMGVQTFGGITNPKLVKDILSSVYDHLTRAYNSIGNHEESNRYKEKLDQLKKS